MLECSAGEFKLARAGRKGAYGRIAGREGVWCARGAVLLQFGGAEESVRLAGVDLSKPSRSRKKQERYLTVQYLFIRSVFLSSHITSSLLSKYSPTHDQSSLVSSRQPTGHTNATRGHGHGGCSTGSTHMCMQLPHSKSSQVCAWEKAPVSVVTMILPTFVPDSTTVSCDKILIFSCEYLSGKVLCSDIQT